MKIALTSISRLFSRGNARFVYHLVGLDEGRATPIAIPISASDFLQLQTPRYLGFGVKALFFDSEHAECFVACRACFYCQHCHYDAYDVRMIKRCNCKPGLLLCHHIIVPWSYLRNRTVEHSRSFLLYPLTLGGALCFCTFRLFVRVRVSVIFLCVDVCLSPNSTTPTLRQNYRQ